MQWLPGVSSHTITTPRLRMHYLEAGPAAGIPVVMLHGNSPPVVSMSISSPACPRATVLSCRTCAASVTQNACRLTPRGGLRDWADDTYALVQALGITAPVHLVGWSTGGAAIANYACDHPGQVASLTFIDPVSPYGFGGTKADGTPCYPDYAGTGGGTANPDFIQRLANQDRSAESPFSIRNVMNSSYWSANHREPADEDLLVDEASNP